MRVSSPERPSNRGGRPRAAGTAWRLVAALLALSCVRTGVRAEDAPGSTTPDAPPRVYALLIGCTEYPAMRQAVGSAAYERRVRLAGCANDVALMRTTLVERFGARSEDVVTLAAWPEDAAARPTAANVAAAFESLASRAYAPGDRVVFHYAGHGVQVTDDDGDERDGLDEALFVADSTVHRDAGFVGTIRDDTVGAWLRRIRARGAAVWCVFDCCHSATGTRFAAQGPERTRSLDAGEFVPDRPPPAASHRGGADAAAPEREDDALDGVTAFYAAQSFQEVPEVEVPDEDGRGTPHGLLTVSLARGLARAAGGMTYGELYERVAAGYRDFGKHHLVQPLADGPLDGTVLGTATGRAPIFVRRLDNGGLQLSVGTLFGVGLGTELDVYAADRPGDAARRVGRVRVKSVRLAVSEVVAASGSDTRWTRDATGVWPADVARLSLGDARVPVAVVDASGRALGDARVAPTLLARLADEGTRARHPRVGRVEEAQWLVVVDERGEPAALRPAVGGRGGPSFRVDGTTLATALATVFRGEGLLRLCARASDLPLPVGLRLVVEREVRGGAKKVAVAPGERVPPGTRLTFRIEKGPGVGSVDVHVFWLDPQFDVKQYFPKRGGSPRLGKDDLTDALHPLALHPAETSDVGAGVERLLLISAPARTPHVDLSFLARRNPLDPTRAAATSEVAALLSDLASGEPDTRRGNASVDRDATGLTVGVFTWTTAWGALRPPRAVEGQPTATVAPLDPAPPPSGDGPPDAWRFGPRVRLAQAGDDAAWCVLVATDEESTQILLDVDGEAPPEARDEPGLTRAVRRGFDAEVAFRLERGRAVAWYDADDDRAFDLVLVDVGRDGRAEVAWRLTDAGWRRTTGLDEPLVSTEHLAWIGRLTGRDRPAGEDARRRAMARLRALTGD